MAKTKNSKTKLVVELNEPIPQRYELIADRVYSIDFRNIYEPLIGKKRWGKYRKFKNPEHLQTLVNGYFASCDGVIYNSKTGKPYEDKHGNPVIGQIKPYTIGGLALYLDITPNKLKEYCKGIYDDLGYDINELEQFSVILRRAYTKIEAYAEERLYDKEGQLGAKFVLDCGFGWCTQKERQEIVNMYETRKLRAKEYELKESLALGDENEDSNITINITRAKKEGN